MINTFISVIIPTFNRSSFLTRSINSVLNQTYNNFKLIVVDDGSTVTVGEGKKVIADLYEVVSEGPTRE